MEDVADLVLGARSDDAPATWRDLTRRTHIRALQSSSGGRSDRCWRGSTLRCTTSPRAGGENLAGEEAFAGAISAGAFAVVQPDVAKWGGVGGCLAVARAALAAGRISCPHFLGGGIGLAASAHLLAAAGGPGLLELDANPNPLRDAFGDGPAGGAWRIGEAPGLGIEALPEELDRHGTLSLTRTRD